MTATKLVSGRTLCSRRQQSGTKNHIRLRDPLDTDEKSLANIDATHVGRKARAWFEHEVELTDRVSHYQERVASMRIRGLVRTISFVLVAFALASKASHAQMAPTGNHYGGRASDTGSSTVSDQGGFSASIPLEFPPSRGGLPIPLQIVSGTKGYGAAGVGWDIPLSYVFVDWSFARRRPQYAPGIAPMPRQRITVALPGRSAEMVPLSPGMWIGRFSPDLLMTASAEGWKVFDSSGFAYTFVQPTLLENSGGPFVGGGLWFLDSISGAGGAKVSLGYDVRQVIVPSSTAPAIAIDLNTIDYNPGATNGCYAHQIDLDYSAPAAAPLGFTILGGVTLARQSHLTGVRVRVGPCYDGGTIRRYALAYQPDPDTLLPRLAAVDLHGRQGTPEASEPIPVARYSYGRATTGSVPTARTLHYQATLQSIPKPAEAGLYLASQLRVTSSVFDAPGSGENYASTQTLLDFTGDGRPDLVFAGPNGQLQIARNAPDASAGAVFGAPTQFTDGTFNRNILDARSSNAPRFSSSSVNAPVVDYLWRQAIDVNGDGRIDFIDATESPNAWMVYLNTPDVGPSGINWEKRAIDITRLRNEFPLAVDSTYFPLSRRTTGTNHADWTCWAYSSVLGHYVDRDDLLNVHPDCFVGGTLAHEVEKTFVEWELSDVNGDGFPDFVFNSAPVEWIQEPPPPGPTPEYRLGTKRYILQLSGTNDVKVAFNVAGLLMRALGSEADPFSSAVDLVEDTSCGVAQWQGGMDGSVETQHAICAFADVNGDGLADRVADRTVRLGAGYKFGAVTSVAIQLPAQLSIGRHQSGFPDCETTNGPVLTTQRAGLRDLTGDGLPDLIARVGATGPMQVYIGTGAGFSSSPVTVDGGFALSIAEESCDGTGSFTTGGLFDIDGDGKPDSVFLQSTPNGWVFKVWRLESGGSEGAPGSGRIVAVSNGVGAKTSISYRSAKEDATTQHQVPFPEIVVDQVETTTTGSVSLGGQLSAQRFAHGNNSLFFDPTLDAFRPTGYLRSVAVAQTATPGVPGEASATAVITDRHPLENLVVPTGLHRYARVGRISSVSSLAVGSNSDPWALLAVDTFTDARRRAGQHVAYASQTVPGQSSAADCWDLIFPYDATASILANSAHDFGICDAHGVTHVQETSAWRGSAAPPSIANVQTRTTVVTADSRGRPLRIHYENDLSRTDDDICIDTTYVTPVSPDAPTLSAQGTRTISGCTEGVNGVTYASDWFEYDQLPLGSATMGLPTSHSVHRHATDNGADLGIIREFDAYYDAAANPILITRTRSHDGAQHVTSLDYDAFHLTPTSVDVTGTDLPNFSTSLAIDPTTMQVVATTDPNGTTTGKTLDGFGRPTTYWIESSQQSSLNGVLTAITYLGFDGSDPQGRRVEIKRFTDPVEDPEDEEARLSTTHLDELGRPRFTAISLGDDYEGANLIVGKRLYDGLGRVSFQADPYSSTQDPATAYGTTQFFAQDGSLAASIRGRGPQAYATVTDDSVERYPTLFTRSYSSYQAVSTVQTADALTPSSPQYGVSRSTTSSAIGWDLTRSTWSGSTRLEYAALSHDRFGHVTGMTRFQDPAAGLDPVTSSWRMDSLGRVIGLTEPSSAPQSRTYSDWGELLKVEWTQATPEPKRSLAYSYDALGRLLHSEEQNDDVPDPETTFDYEYDYPRESPFAENSFILGRLAYARTSQETEFLFGYDALGNVNARTYIDSDDTPYWEGSEVHADGSLASITLALPDNGYDLERVDYAYDTAARLRWMWYSDSSDFKELYSASSIDAWGRLREATLGEATFEAVFADVGRRLPISAVVIGNSQSRKISSAGYDPVGRITSRSLELAGFNGLETVSYDALGRLNSAVRQQGPSTPSQWTFSYDALGNIRNLNDALGSDDASLTYQTTDRDRVCRIGYGDNGFSNGTACNVSHDSIGNISEAPGRFAERYFEYFNSGAARKIESGSTRAIFSYDPFGSVQDVAIDENLTPLRIDRNFGALITKRHQVGSNVGADYIARRFPGDGFTVGRRGDPGGPWVVQFSDSRGLQFTTSLEGSFLQDIDYRPFGEATTTGAQPGFLEFSTENWNGGDALDSLGIVYVGARLYDPVIGRFLSRDPLLLPRGAGASNPYAFALNDPINFADPSGLCAGQECEDIDWFGGWGQLWGSSSPQTDRGKELLIGATLSGGYPGPGFNFDSRGASLAGAIDAARMNGTYSGGSLAGATWASIDATSEHLPIIGTARKAWRREWRAAGLSLTIDLLTLGEGRLIAAASGEATGLFATFGANGLLKAGAFRGEWKVIGEAAGGIEPQINSVACGFACGRRLAGTPQTQLIARAQTPGPIGAEALARAMGNGWEGGYVGGHLPKLLRLPGGFIGMLRNFSGAQHWVVVSADESGLFRILDPWGKGSTYFMTPRDFVDFWTGHAVYLKP